MFKTFKMVPFVLMAHVLHLSMSNTLCIFRGLEKLKNTKYNEPSYLTEVWNLVFIADVSFHVSNSEHVRVPSLLVVSATQQLKLIFLHFSAHSKDDSVVNSMIGVPVISVAEFWK